MGQLNRRALLRQLQKLGVASRAELAKALGMSQPTAGKIVDELIEMDVLEEVAVALPESGERNGDTVVGQLGRPGRQLRLNESRAKFLGIALGVKTTHLAGLTLGLLPTKTGGRSRLRLMEQIQTRPKSGRKNCARPPNLWARMIFWACC